MLRTYGHTLGPKYELSILRTESGAAFPESDTLSSGGLPPDECPHLPSGLAPSRRMIRLDTSGGNAVLPFLAGDATLRPRHAAAAMLEPTLSSNTTAPYCAGFPVSMSCGRKGPGTEI